MSVVFELSSDPALLAQYYCIREASFRRELGVEAFDGAEDQHDLGGRILIAKEVDDEGAVRCVGGVRISGRQPVHSDKLPMEQDGLDLQKLFPELALNRRGYCQWARFVLLPEYRTYENLKTSFEQAIRFSRRLGYHYSFNIAGVARARLYKKIHSSLGHQYRIYKGVKLHKDEGFDDLEHLLSVSWLQPNADRKNTGKRQQLLPAGSPALDKAA